MMLRLTLAARIGLIVLMGVFVAWLSVIALFYVSRSASGDADGGGLPVAGQVAALVELLERTPLPQRPLVLRAASSENFVARTETGTVVATTASAPLPLRYQRALESYLSALGGHPISVSVNNSRNDRRLFWRLRPPTVEIRIGINPGEVLVIDERSALLLGPLGLPIGFGAGIFGTLIALLALLVMQRETGPLARLAEAVDRVDLSIEPALLPETKRSAPEIRVLVAAFNRLQRRLAELLRGRMAMLGGISHDVRTFATRLRLRVDKIGDENERERAIADINDMVRLLDDALLASRAGAGELVNEMVEIDEVIRAEVRDRHSAGALLDYREGDWDRPPIVLGDRLALKRVVANLADNAIKYGTRAHLASRIDDTDFVLTIDDDGPGIPREMRSAMLEPFSRLEISRSRATGGAGLGLSIARGLTEAHGGSLTIEDGPTGAGARIILRVPLFYG
jgi:signal transduction histidine kinase